MGERLDRRVRAASPALSWTRIREAIARGQVTVDDEIVRDPGALIADEAAVVFDAARRRLPHAHLDLARLYEDEDILVIDKPAGLLTMATDAASRHDEDTVLARAKDYASHLRGRTGYAGLLHRLDRETSGALALALSREAHARGRELFAQHAFERHYLAIVRGVLDVERGTVEAAVSHAYAGGRRRLARRGESGRPAVTHYVVREQFESAALVELELDTGRQHQIRLHMQSLGHPLVGDEVYGAGAGRTSEAGRAGRAARHMLHAWRLAFPHPLHQTMIRVEAPVPDDFTRVLRSLRGRTRAGR